MRIIDCKVQDEYIVGDGVFVGATGSHDDVALRLTFGDMWEGKTKKVQFTDALGTETVERTLIDAMKDDSGAYIVPIPYEAKRYPGEMAVTVKGAVTNDETDPAEETCATLAVRARFIVKDSGWDADAAESHLPTPSDAELILEAAAAEADRATEQAGLAGSAAEGAAVSASAAADDAVQARGFSLSAQGFADNAYRAKNAAAGSASDAAAAASAAAASAQDAARDRHTHANKSVLDAIAQAVKDGYDRLVSLLANITSIVTTLGADDTTIPTSKAVRDALANKVDKITGKGLSTNDFTNALKNKVNNALQPSAKGVPGGVASLDDEGKVPTAQLRMHDMQGVIGIDEQNRDVIGSFVGADGVAVVPMISSTSGDLSRRPGLVRAWGERYGTLATAEGALCGAQKTVAQFYAKDELGEDVFHGRGFISKGTLLNLMGNPQGAALIATQGYVNGLISALEAAVAAKGNKMEHITTATASEATALLSVDLRATPLREVFLFVTVVGASGASGNVQLRFKNGENSAARTIGTLTAGATKHGIVKISTVCPGIKLFEKTTLTADAGMQKSSDYYYFEGSAPDGIDTIELVSVSGSAFAAGTELKICGVKA